MPLKAGHFRNEILPLNEIFLLKLGGQEYCK